MRRMVAPNAVFFDLNTDFIIKLIMISTTNCVRQHVARNHCANGQARGLPAGGCNCELCATLGTFLADPRRRTFEWPLAEPRRKHVHSRIDTAELPVTHVTRRLGRPFTLVLSKTDALFTGEHSAREAAKTDLEWLTGRWNIPA
jgi:hypothetical protein